MTKKAIRDIPLGTKVKSDYCGTGRVIAYNASYRYTLLGYTKEERQNGGWGWTLKEQGGLLWRDKITASTKSVDELCKEYASFFWVVGENEKFDIVEEQPPKPLESKKLGDCIQGSVVEFTDEKSKGIKGTIIAIKECGELVVGFDQTTNIGALTCQCQPNDIDMSGYKCIRSVRSDKQVIVHSVPKQNEKQEWLESKDIPLGATVELRNESKYNGGTVIAKNGSWLTLGFDEQVVGSWDIKGSVGLGYGDGELELLADKEVLHKNYKYGRNINVEDNKFKIVEQPDKAKLKIKAQEEKEAAEKYKAEQEAKKEEERLCIRSSESEIVVSRTTVSINAPSINLNTDKLKINDVEFFEVLDPVYIHFDGKNWIYSNKPPKQQSSLKDEAKDALYRIATNQITKGIKTVLLKQMQKSGHTNIKALSDILDTEYGTAILSAITGQFLTYLPTEDDQIKRLAKEFRIGGYAIAGNAAFTDLIEYIGPVVAESLADIPKQQVRIEPAKTITPEAKEEDNEETIDGTSNQTTTQAL